LCLLGEEMGEEAIQHTACSRDICTRQRQVTTQLDEVEIVEDDIVGFSCRVYSSPIRPAGENQEFVNFRKTDK
jgi:hypothetical protein